MGMPGPVGLVAAAALAALAAWNDVPTTVTAEDRAYSELILAEAGYPRSAALAADLASFEGQIRAILAVQDAVLKATPRSDGVALDRGREPKDLHQLRQGLCFDRSRVMEKMLSSLGLPTRHASIYATVDRSVLVALLTPENRSHAVTEVKTARGWMVIDSNVRWIGLDDERAPVSLDGLQRLAGRSARWAAESLKPINPIFRSEFVFVRGLYSRHGRFYAPYAPFPDVSLAGLLENFGE